MNTIAALEALRDVLIALREAGVLTLDVMPLARYDHAMPNPFMEGN